MTQLQRNSIHSVLCPGDHFPQIGVFKGASHSSSLQNLYDIENENLVIHSNKNKDDL